MSTRPRARKTELVIQELPGELLVYDLTRHRAHCLNASAAAVWRACDGRSDPLRIAARASRTLGAELPPEAVELALEQLDHARLVEGVAARSTRRQALKTLGVLLPAVITVLAPSAAHAAPSCLGESKNCKRNFPPPCCPGLTCRCVVQGGTMQCRCQP